MFWGSLLFSFLLRKRFFTETSALPAVELRLECLLPKVVFMGVPAQTPQVIRFGEFELDLQAEELRKAGVRVKIQEQPSQVLLTLVSRRGELVTRNDLRRQLWAADTFVDFETGLNRSIAKLREVLGDSPDAPRYIKTVPRKGYRFIAPVETISGAPATDGIVPSTSSPVKWKIKRHIIAAVVVIVPVLALAAYWARGAERRALGSGGRKMLVVLPFENLTGDPGQEFFTDGVTEETITQLGRLQAKDLGVIARSSAMKYKHSSASVAEIAKGLHVNYIVEGSVRREASRVRIAVQLIRAGDQTQLWADTYDRGIADVLAVQSEIAQTIGKQLELHLVGTQLSAAQTPYAVEANPVAYEHYLRGRSYVFAGFDTPQALRRAQGYFEDAIRQDPDFGRAYAGLAASYVLLSEFRWLPPNEAYRPAKEAIRKALQLDPSLGEAHTALAWLSWRHDWDWATAEKEYRYACELNPNDVDAHQGLTWFLAWSRRGQDAFSQIAKIRQLDPAQAVTIDEAGVYFHSRDYKSLVEVGQKSVVSRPDFWVTHYFLGVGYEGAARLSDAISEYEKAVQMSQGDSDPSSALAHAYATAGRNADAEKILQRLQQSGKTSYVSPYMIATIYAGLGDKEKAFEYLEKAYQERSTDLPYFLKADLRIDTLRSDPRLKDIETRVGLPQ